MVRLSMPAIQTISFTADAGGGTPLYFSHRDTEVRIRPVGGTNLRGTLNCYGEQQSRIYTRRYP